MPLLRLLGSSLLLIATVAATDAPAAPAARPAPAHRMRFCGFGGDRELLVGLQRYWRDLEYCRAYDEGQLDNVKALAAAARELGVVFSVQSCAPAFPPGYLERNQCWAVDFLGRKPADLGMTHPVADYCHPATVAALKGNLDVALRDVGAASFTMVDYVWPWVGGRWGCSAADVAAYRAALKGSDGGLRLVGAGGERVLSFWDYLAELSGLRFRPEDVGCASWDDYEPARPPEVEKNPTEANRRSFFLFHALYHYCWLRYAQDCGAHARELGGELQASLNPENIGNGGDLLTWARLQATGEPWLEEWGPAWIAIAGYHNFPYFTRAYRAANKRLGLIGETGAAGGHPDSGFGPARPHYWDPNSNYAITYALGADGQFDDREEDYIWAPLAEMEDPGGPQYDCWRGYVRAMDGFRQYTLDGAHRPACAVLHVTNRSVLHYADNSESSTNQPYSLSQPLIDLHYDYVQAFFPLDRALLDEYRIVLFSPWEYPPPVAAMLRDWLDAAPGRTLVLHSFVPARPCRGLHLYPSPEVEEPEAGRAFGLEGLRQTDVRTGQITEVAPEWRASFALPLGEKVSLPRGLVECHGRPLVKLGTANLVTEVCTAKGGRIVYLNFAPPERYPGSGDSHAALLRACLEAILREAGVSPQAVGPPGWACARYDLEGGCAFVLLNQEATGLPRFTEETTSMAPAAKLSLVLQPNTEYWAYDLLDQTAAHRRTDASGSLPVPLSGRNIRLLHLLRDRRAPFILFTDGERQDRAPRPSLPARLHAHRGGVVVLAGLGASAQVLLDGRPVATDGDSAAPGSVRLRLPRGGHTLEVR